jgi:hypothetical protein
MLTTSQLPAEGRAVSSASERVTTPLSSDSETQSKSGAESATENQPEYADIEVLAYSYYLARRESGEGSAEEDWLRAEQELRSQQSAKLAQRAAVG